MSSIILDLNKYSQEVILKGEEYRKKEMEKREEKTLPGAYLQPT